MRWRLQRRSLHAPLPTVLPLLLGLPVSLYLALHILLSDLFAFALIREVHEQHGRRGVFRVSRAVLLRWKLSPRIRGVPDRSLLRHGHRCSDKLPGW